MGFSSDPTKLTSLAVAGVPTMGMSGIPATAGNVWFVSSVSGSAGGAGTASDPFNTITLAQTNAVAGDIVVLLAGHAETVSGAAGITLSKAGITYVGLGVGAKRPTFTFGTSTAATFVISGANISLTNIVGIAALDQIVSPFVVSGANVTLALTWQDGSSILEALRAVLTTAAADNFNLSLVFQGYTAGSHNVNAVRLVGGRNATVNVNYYGVLTTAVVEFVTTAVVDAQITGQFYVSGTTNLSKNVVDTITGSTWTVTGFDGAAGLSFDGGSGKAIAGNDTSTVIAGIAVPAADAVTNALERDVIGNKTDASVYSPGTTKSLMAYAKGNSDLQEGVAVSAAAAVMVNGDTLFTIAGGPIEILSLMSICQTANNGTASTLQYSSSGTLGTTTQTISGATATLANAAIGTNVTAQLTALATAPVINANGANILATPGGIVVPAGTIKAVIGVGSTTGTWLHYIRYRPLAKGVTVV